MQMHRRIGREIRKANSGTPSKPRGEENSLPVVDGRSLDEDMLMRMSRGGERPSMPPRSGFRWRIARRLLHHRILLGQVASGVAEPIRLDVVPDLRERDRMIVADLRHIDRVRG